MTSGGGGRVTQPAYSPPSFLPTPTQWLSPTGSQRSKVPLMWSTQDHPQDREQRGERRTVGIEGQAKHQQM